MSVCLYSAHLRLQREQSNAIVLQPDYFVSLGSLFTMKISINLYLNDGCPPGERCVHGGWIGQGARDNNIPLDLLIKGGLLCYLSRATTTCRVFYVPFNLIILYDNN